MAGMLTLKERLMVLWVCKQKQLQPENKGKYDALDETALKGMFERLFFGTYNCLAKMEGDEDEDKEDEPEASVPMFDMQSRFSPAALKSSSFGAFLSSADLEIGGGAEDYDDANAGAGASADAGAGAGAGAGADYHTKLAGLELEFVELDQQYHQILKGVDGAGSAVDTADAAERLVEVIRRLHEKGRELRELRSSPSK